ncbi:MAG: O-antigen ligase family protein [Motiliproteus sp.]
MTTFKPGYHQKDSSAAFFFLLLYTATVLIRPHEIWVSFQDWIIIKVFAILCFLMTLLSVRPLKLYPQHWMLLGLIPFIVVSAFLNGWGMFGIEQSQKLLVSSIIPLFLFSACVNSYKKQHILMWVCMVAAVLMLHNGYTQRQDPYAFGWAGNSHYVGEGRITYLGFFSDPNDMGMLFVMLMPFVVYFYAIGGGVKKLLMLGVLAGLGYGIYMTDSRGTLLGAIALISMYFLISYGGARLILISILSAPILATLLSSFRGISASGSSAQGRLDAWYDGIQMLIHNPLFGIGMGNFVDVHGLTAHNSYVLIAGELGVPGYSLWGGALVFTVYVSYMILQSRKAKKSEDSDELIQPPEVSGECLRELLLNKTLFYSMVGYMITAFFLSRTYTLLLFIFMGMTIASHIRLFKLIPEYLQFYNWALAFKCMGYSWAIIVAVYLTLKVAL